MSKVQSSTDQPTAMPFAESTREEVKDKYLNHNLESLRLEYKLFVRLGAKDRQFRKVRFNYSIFDSCYLRNCIFDSCDFTGCRFINSNLMGARFDGCIFDYATFEKTQIDESILDSSCPSHENQKQRFARSLRVNYQQLGDTRGANKAIAIELEATHTYLYKAWKSNESYYRHKFKGLERVKMFFRWLEFRSLDIIWGNGENLLKLIWSVFVVLLAIAVLDRIYSDITISASAILESLNVAPAIFLGTLSPKGFPPLLLAIIVFIRLVFMGFFMSMIIKKFNRR
jgi:pentapeptide repeat protein